MRLYQQELLRNSPPENLIYFSNTCFSAGSIVWMRKITPLLLDDQLHRAVIGTQNGLMDDHIFHLGNEFL